MTHVRTKTKIKSINTVPRKRYTKAKIKFTSNINKFSLKNMHLCLTAVSKLDLLGTKESYFKPEQILFT